MRKPTSFLAAFLTAVPISCADIQETLSTSIGKPSFTHDLANKYPTKETVATLFDQIDFQRT